MKQNKTNENGRSMVEMLGVLALIGIITIGGIKGYEIATQQIGLNKLSDVMQYAVMSLESKKPIYEQLRGEDGQFPGVEADATKLFADTYHLDYQEKDLNKTPCIYSAPGILLSDPMRFSLNVVKDSVLGSQEQLIFVVKSCSGTNQSEGETDVKLLQSMLRWARDLIKANPVMRKRLHAIGNINQDKCRTVIYDRTDAGIDAAFDKNISGDCFYMNNVPIYFRY